MTFKWSLPNYYKIAKIEIVRVFNRYRDILNIRWIFINIPLVLVKYTTQFFEIGYINQYQYQYQSPAQLK